MQLMALWMEKYPCPPRITSNAVRPTGCVLVSPDDRVLALDRTGEAHAIVRAILNCENGVGGSDIYVSRFPCSLCTKVMVQAGIRRIYYFPALDWEMDWTLECERTQQSVDPPQLASDGYSSTNSSPDTKYSHMNSIGDLSDGWTKRAIKKREANLQSVSRLITNSPIAFSIFIPRWTETNYGSFTPMWFVDHSLANTPTLAHPSEKTWNSLCKAFENTQIGISQLYDRYNCVPEPLSDGQQPLEIQIAQHAIVLAHIVSKRTDDPKIGVGAVLVNPSGKYVSVGWNGYPKRSTATDYPQAGADDCVDDQALKYDYILHAEQNALLWRTGPIAGCMLVSTKMPCDECSPVISDCGISVVVTNHQLPKLPSDPARLRGLSYHKLKPLISDIWLFPKDKP